MRVNAVMQPTSQPAALPVLPVGTVLKAAASELARSGQDAAVIEKAKRVLGRLRVRAADRFTFEDPFHIVYARPPRRRLMVWLVQKPAPHFFVPANAALCF